MSVYYCNHCDKLKDKDFELPHPDPESDEDWICESCLVELEHKNANA